MKDAIELTAKIKDYKNYILLIFNKKDLEKNNIKIGDKVRFTIP